MSVQPLSISCTLRPRDCNHCTAASIVRSTDPLSKEARIRLSTYKTLRILWRLGKGPRSEAKLVSSTIPALTRDSLTIPWQTLTAWDQPIGTANKRGNISVSGLTFFPFNITNTHIRSRNRIKDNKFSKEFSIRWKPLFCNTLKFWMLRQWAMKHSVYHFIKSLPLSLSIYICTSTYTGLD